MANHASLIAMLAQRSIGLACLEEYSSYAVGFENRPSGSVLAIRVQ